MKNEILEKEMRNVKAHMLFLPRAQKLHPAF
jgi:hypothetical protein